MATAKRINGQLLDGSGNGIAGVVQAQMRSLAFVNSGEVVPRNVLAIADATGNYAFDPAAAVPNGLYSNSDLTPANTSWVITPVAGGVPYPSYAIVVPPGAGPFVMNALVVSSPALPAQYVAGVPGPTGPAGPPGDIRNSFRPETFGAVGNNPAHDDSPAIEQALFAAAAAAIADNSFYGEVVLDASKVYYALRAPQVDATYNGVHSYAYAQIALPAYVTPNVVSGVVLRIKTTGRGHSSFTPASLGQAGMTSIGGGSIVSTATGQAFSGSYGQPSVIGGPQVQQTPAPPAGAYAYWTSIWLYIEALGIYVPTNPTLAGLDTKYCDGLTIEGTLEVATNIANPVPGLSTSGVAVIGPEDAWFQIRGRLNIMGFYYGLSWGNHLQANQIEILKTQYALAPSAGGDTGVIARFNSINNVYDFTPLSNVPGPLVVDALCSEGLGGAAIWDPSNYMRIRGHCDYRRGRVGLPIPVGGGGAGLNLQDVYQSAGPQTPPVFPASGALFENPFGRDAFVGISGAGSVALKLGTTAAGSTLSAGPPWSGVVPSNGFLTLTYSGGGSAYDAAVLADNPFAFWKMAEASGTVAVDSSGNAHTGTYNGAVALAAVGPCSDSETAASFPGATTAYVLAASTKLIGGSANLSIEAWGTKLASDMVVYAERGTSGNDILKLAYAAGSNQIQLTYRDDAGTLTQILGTRNIADTNYHHIVLTKTGTAIAIYIDGVLDKSGVVTGNDNFTDATLKSMIGLDPTVASPWNGRLGKVALYTTALSANRVAAHYAGLTWAWSTF